MWLLGGGGGLFIQYNLEDESSCILASKESKSACSKILFSLLDFWWACVFNLLPS